MRSLGAEDGLDVLRDRLAIEDVLIRYAETLDAGDIDGFLSCFTPDATITYYDGDIVIEGHQQFRDLLTRNRSDGRVSPTDPNTGSTHCMTNIAAQVDGDTARATTTAMITMVGRGAQAGQTIQHGARYSDDLVRVGGEWKIASRRHRQVWKLETDPSDARR
ncbi:MAG: nuclear transport factor 2 family protein [Acidimicrobiia bacterium]